MYGNFHTFTINVIVATVINTAVADAAVTAAVVVVNVK